MERPRRGFSFGGLYLAAVYLFLFGPALLVILFSFNASRFWAFPIRELTLRWYRALADRPDAAAALENSLIVAIPTVIITVLLGTGLSLALYRREFRFKGALEGFVLLPLLVPGIIWTIALLLSFVAAGVPLGAPAVIVGQVLFCIPYASLLTSARLHSLDPQLEEAARSLGASSAVVLRRIVLPHLLPSLISSVMLIFAISFSDVIIAFFLGGGGFNTLPVFIYAMIQSEPSPMVNSISSLVLLVGVLCLGAAFRIGGREVVTARERGGL